VLAEVKAAVGDDFPVIYRLSSEEFVPGGLTIGDTTNFSVTLVEHGVDAIHVSGGVYESAAMIIQPAAVPQGLYISNAAAIKEAIGSKIPVMVVGRIKDPVMAAEIIEKGHADMIALGRSLLADPEFPEKVRAGTPENISPCIGCNQACIDRLFQDQDLACLGNPFTGREWQYNPEEKAGSSKRVLVIGGGPGGLEASRIAALRGHEVFLYEKDEKLGGLMSIASIPPHREEIRELVDFLISQVEKLGVNIRLGRAVDEVVINAVKPDTIVMATGSKPLVPSFIGEEKENVVTTGEAILTGAPFGRNVVVAGGGLVGCETAEFMAAKGARVTILEMLDDIGIGMGTLDKALLLNRLKELKVAMITGCKVKAFEGKNVIAEKAGREEVINEVDTIVLSLGYQPEVAILPLIKRMKIPYCMIGDCVEPRKITEAIYEGFINAYQL
jgi:NADPH-dependent 2,4-dienoyl-CoA reductase/sulfur reductase-like enzyme